MGKFFLPWSTMHYQSGSHVQRKNKDQTLFIMFSKLYFVSSKLQ